MAIKTFIQTPGGKPTKLSKRARNIDVSGLTSEELEALSDEEKMKIAFGVDDETPTPTIAETAFGVDDETPTPTIAETPVIRLAKNNPLLTAGIPGRSMETVESDAARKIADTENVMQNLFMMEQQVPLPSEADYGAAQPGQGEPVASLQGYQQDQLALDLPNAVLNEIPDDQRQRERVKPITEKFSESGFKIRTLAGIRAAINGTNNWMVGPMERAANMAENLKASAITQAELDALQTTGSLEAGYTVRARRDAERAGKDWEFPKFPAFKKGTTEIATTQTAILYHPDLLDAGLWDANAREGKGAVLLDKDFLETMSLTTEQFYAQGMATRSDEDIVSEVDPNDPGESRISLSKYTKAEGRLALGKDIFKQWKRVQADKRQLPTDAYAVDFKDISDEVFHQLGDFAKEAYFLTNGTFNSQSGLMMRNIRSDGQTEFKLSPEGEMYFKNLYHNYSAMFGAHELPPLSSPSATGQMIFEGITYTRSVTTAVNKDLGDPEQIFEAALNAGKVAVINEPVRQQAAVALITASINTAGNPTPRVDVNGKFEMAQDPNEIYLTETYQGYFPQMMVDLNIQRDTAYDYEVGEAAYSDMFGIGPERFRLLQQEKARLYKLAATREREAVLDPRQQLGAGWDLYLTAKRYDPAKILGLEREKLISIIAGASKYSGKRNYLTYALQALTGRIHAQQSIYNPQAHKVLRYIIGGGRTYTWKPGDNTELDIQWMELISAQLYEGDFKDQFGIARSAKERVRVFREEEKNPDPNSLHMKYVRWGEQLEKTLSGFDYTATGKLFENFVNASGNPQVREQAQTALQQVFPVNPNTGKPQNELIPDDLKKFLSGKEEGAIAVTDYLRQLARYHRIKKHNKENPNNQQEMRANPVIEEDGQTFGPSSLAVLLGSESMAMRSGMIIKQNFAEMMNGDFKDLRDAMVDAMRNKYDSISSGITFINFNNTNYYKEILEEAFLDRTNFLKQSPMTLGYGQDIKSMREHVETTVIQSKEIQRIINEQGLSEDQVIDFLHTLMIQSIYDTMDADTISAAKVIKSVGYLSALTGVVFEVDQATGLKSTVAGRDSVGVDEKGKQLTTSYTMSYKDPQTGEERSINSVALEQKIQELPLKIAQLENTNALGDNQWVDAEINQAKAELARANKQLAEVKKRGVPKQVTVSQYRSVVSPAAMRNMAGKKVLGGYATGRLLPALIQAFDAFMVASVFTNWSFLADSGKPTARGKERLPTGYWDHIKAASVRLGKVGYDPDMDPAEKKKLIEEHVPFIIPIFDAFITDLGSAAATRKIANDSYQKALVNGLMSEHVYNYYKDILHPALVKIDTSKDYDWTDPTNPYFMLRDLFFETDWPRIHKDGKVNVDWTLVNAIKRLSWDAKEKIPGEDSMKWREGKETLKEWDKRTTRVARAKAEALTVKLISLFEEQGIVNKQNPFAVFRSSRVNGKIVKVMLREVMQALNISSNMDWLNTTIPAKRAALRDKLKEKGFTNINISKL